MKKLGHCHPIYWPKSCAIVHPHPLIPAYMGSPESKSQTTSRSVQPTEFSRFCTAHGRKSLYFTTGHPFSHGDLDRPTSNTWFLGPTRIGISIDSAVSAQLTPERPYILQWTALSPQNCPYPLGDLDSPSPEPKTASRSVQPLFTGLTTVTDRPTDRQTTLLSRWVSWSLTSLFSTTQSVTIGQVYIRSTAMRPNNGNMQQKFLLNI